MRKREVIELRYRIDCMGWSSTSKGHQQETVASARLWTHTGVREHGIPDIKTYGIPGRPGWFREKNGREYRPMQWRVQTKTTGESDQFIVPEKAVMTLEGRD
jgi:hypothetical protein